MQALKLLKYARRCESFLRASFSFRSSASEVRAKRSIGADTRVRTGIRVRQSPRGLRVRAARTAWLGWVKFRWPKPKDDPKGHTEPKVKTAACTCLISFQNNAPLSTHSVSYCNKQCQRARRAKHSRAVDERSIGRSVAESSRAESSQRSKTLRVGSESSFSLSLERQRGAGETENC